MWKYFFCLPSLGGYIFDHLLWSIFQSSFLHILQITILHMLYLCVQLFMYCIYTWLVGTLLACTSVSMSLWISYCQSRLLSSRLKWARELRPLNWLDMVFSHVYMKQYAVYIVCHRSHQDSNSWPPRPRSECNKWRSRPLGYEGWIFLLWKYVGMYIFITN